MIAAVEDITHFTRMGFGPFCDGGCGRCRREDDPAALWRLGWEVIGPSPVAEWHPPHSPAQPFLVRGYMQWVWPKETKALCATCAQQLCRS